MVDLSWLSETMNALRSFFPRREIVRNTHKGVKWSLWRRPREVKPGVRWYWPLITDMEVIPTARQTLGLAVQNLTTKDGKTVVVGGVVVYSIRDVLLAIGEKNYDVDDTVAEISRAAIVTVVSKWNLQDPGNIETELTKECRRRLRQFGVSVHRAALAEFCEPTPLSLIGIPENANT